MPSPTSQQILQIAPKHTDHLKNFGSDLDLYGKQTISPEDLCSQIPALWAQAHRTGHGITLQKCRPRTGFLPCQAVQKQLPAEMSLSSSSVHVSQRAALHHNSMHKSCLCLPVLPNMGPHWDSTGALTDQQPPGSAPRK